METETNVNKGIFKRLVSRLFPQKSKWEPVSKGPAVLHGERVTVERYTVEGSYVMERNQHGDVRYVVTDGDGNIYTRSANEVTTKQEVKINKN